MSNFKILVFFTLRQYFVPSDDRQNVGK